MNCVLTFCICIYYIREELCVCDFSLSIVSVLRYFLVSEWETFARFLCSLCAALFRAPAFLMEFCVCCWPILFFRTLVEFCLSNFSCTMLSVLTVVFLCIQPESALKNTTRRASALQKTKYHIARCRLLNGNFVEKKWALRRRRCTLLSLYMPPLLLVLIFYTGAPQPPPTIYWIVA